MKNLILGVCLFCFALVCAQAPNNGFYVNSTEKDVFKFPNSTNINETTINSRTYEMYFNANSTVTRQFLFMEGNDKRGILCYIESGYLVVGAYNIDTNDYADIWEGTYFRKAISANTWYHVAMVFDNLPIPIGATSATDNTSFKWYLDGVLQDEKAGFQIGGSGNHKELFVGFKDDKLFFPTVAATWTSSGQSEYSFGEQINEDGGDENYFDGYLWGFRVWDDVRTSNEINDNKTNLILSVNTDDLLVALDGDTMTYLMDDVSTDLDSDSPPTLKEWEGNTDSNWFNVLNWKNGLVPDNAKQEPVKIKKQSTFYPQISSLVVAGDVLLEYHDTEPGTITIKDNGTFDIAYDLVNDGIITIENNGILCTRESTPVTGVGSVTLERNTPNYPANYYSIWSTPFAELDSQLGSIFTNSVDIFEYDASQDPALYVARYGSDFMKVGTGYFVRSDSDSGVLTRTFSGTLNNGHIDKQLYYNSATDNDNLIGNPYSSAINWKSFYEDNSSVLEGTMYFWEQSMVGVNNSVDDYKSYNYGTGPSEPGYTEFIAAGLGVFVETTQAGTVTFKNSHRVDSNNNLFYRKTVNTDIGKSWFRLTGSMGYRPILVGFIPGATNEYETAYDAQIFSEGTSIEFYTILEDKKLEIEGRLVLQPEQNVQVPLGFKVAAAGNYTLSMVLDYIDESFDVLLEDKEQNAMTDLRTTDYNFSVEDAIEDNNRFVLHYNYINALSTEDFNNAQNRIKTLFVDDQLKTIVTNGVDPKSILIYDLNGKEILNTSFKTSINTRNLSEGIYVIKYYLGDSKVLTKKVIKK